VPRPHPAARPDGARGRAPARAAALRRPRPDEHRALLDWLDDGLRSGRRGRLLGEYPTALEPGARARHFVAWVDERPASHALVRIAHVTARGRTLPLGMIGLVYTDPAFRGHGLAGRCIEACVRHLVHCGVPLAALWSERHSFYARLGFHPAGHERLFQVGRACAAQARLHLPGPWRVEPPGAADWAALEALYAAKPAHVLRRPGELARLARCPDSRLVLARSGARPVAYAALGRGDDFGGVVHEWAGEGGGVVACLAELLGGREELLLLAGPHEEEPLACLSRAGAAVHRGCFALLRLLDAPRLWRALTWDEPSLAGARLSADADGLLLEAGGRRARLDAAGALELLLGPGCPAAVRPLLGGALPGAALPWPLFAWGFDSI
jgi:GNAT superfamily N-acetyltransferase